MIRYLLDTNVVLRFLRNDHTELSPKAVALFSEAQRGACVLVLPSLILAECVYVLHSFYKCERKAISTVLTAIVDQTCIETDDQAVALEALERFGATNIDYADCYLAARAALHSDGVATFDRDFKQFADVRLWEAAEGQDG